MKHIVLYTIVILSIGLGGCSLVAPPYQGSVENAQSLKRAKLPEMAVGAISSTNASPQISLRGSKMKPTSGNYGQYIAEAITSELKMANLYQPLSNTIITGELLSHDINVTGFSTGEGLMEVKFVITKAGQPVLEKTYSQKIEFESSFMGAIAISNGQLAYKDLVQQLIKQFFSDPEFTMAIKS